MLASLKKAPNTTKNHYRQATDAVPEFGGEVAIHPMAAIRVCFGSSFSLERGGFFLNPLIYN
ncbi:MAG: hypothetical protein EPO31_15015 [Gammaproteobacteria bacterium]|jgi:hypothetical protein|nr:MAG: hypothetical protein EPO31_15015 [Gammaproteobacteria bacterium]